ncbi:MAG: SIR2 family protein [Nitrososphaerales archaeon]
MLNLKCDIEEFLAWLANEFYKITPQTSDDFKRSQYLQKALGQSFYFIYELLRHYTLTYIPKFDNYRRLALHYHDCRYNVITLNYDTLFEAAIQSVKLNFHYFQGPHHPKSIPIAKLHGSINWVNPCRGGIAYEGVMEDAFSVITSSIFSNKFWVMPLKILPPAAIRDICYKDFVRSGIDYDEPALIPPFADYKDYEKVERYKEVWAFAESMLREASELIVIGCSVRPQDRKFNELLRKSLKDGIAVTVVSRHPDVVLDRLKIILTNPQFESPFESFEDYAKTL